MDLISNYTHWLSFLFNQCIYITDGFDQSYYTILYYLYIIDFQRAETLY